MKKKKIPRPLYQDLNFDDFRWCIDNDYQVYVFPLTSLHKETYYNDKTDELTVVENYIETGKYKIAVRKNGITTEGYDQKVIKGKTVKSKETIGELTFNSQREAFEHLNYVYGYLRRKYG